MPGIEEEGEAENGQKLFVGKFRDRSITVIDIEIGLICLLKLEVLA